MQEGETTKYVIYATIVTDGVVERPDIIGAIFGQTEGLLGEELDLRDLQRTGRIGRIEVSVESKGGKSKGEIVIPSSLDKTETAILAAALETIDRVGPCGAVIEVLKVEDVRAAKRKQIIERAKKIVQSKFDEEIPETQELTDEVRQAIRIEEITSFHALPAGPNIMDSDAILIVEGRADVLNLLRHGIKNAIAVEGTSIPRSIAELSKKKTVTAFVDGDRGGELILKELLQVAEIDYVARAPDGKGVEELSQKEIIKALRNKLPVEQVLGRREFKRRKERKDAKNSFLFHLEKLSGTLCARLLNDQNELLKEVAVRDLAEAIKEADKSVSSVIFDGIITQRLVDLASEKGLRYLVGAKIGSVVKVPLQIKILSLQDLKS
jgi:DNA primase